ncbi:MAG: 30S ribosomal protein S17 [bacterium]|nr:30S ribosomal protein S17 [bacterium]
MAKVLTGKIISDKMTKTVVVAVDFPKTHPQYGKKIRWTKKFKAHTEKRVKMNEKVKIQETRPFSKEVSWEVVEVLK